MPCPSGDTIVACLRSKSPSNGLEEEKGRKLQDKGQSLFSDHLIGITLPCSDMLANASSFQFVFCEEERKLKHHLSFSANIMTCNEGFLRGLGNRLLIDALHSIMLG